MTGMNRHTGQPMSLLENVKQSITDILTTPIGSRVMRRDYGSLLPELIDAPGNATTRQQLIAASVDALTRWEPRITIQQVSPQLEAGRWQLSINATLTDGSPLNQRVTLVGGTNG